MSYGPDYFDDNIELCRCFTCEDKVRECPATSMPSTYIIPDAGTQHTSPESEQSAVSTVQLDHAEFEPPEHEAPEMEQPENEPHETVETAEESELQLIKKEKKVKGDDKLECLVCHTIVKRMDRHILKHSEIFNAKQMRFILDFHRTKNAPKKQVIYDCLKCFRRFASLVMHKHVDKCDCLQIEKVDNPGSRSSLPESIRTSIKSKVLPGMLELAVAQRFVDYKTSLAQCSGEEKKWSQDRGGTVQLMGQLFNMTCGLKKPELLKKGCLDLQKTRNLKPQTMLNYLSTFLLFVDYCYLAKEINISQNEEARMKSAIRDTRRAFGPSAAEDYRKTADEMRGRVPCSALVRERYRQKIMRILEANLINNELTYRKQQVFNFFLLQGRINTRFVFSKIN